VKNDSILQIRKEHKIKYEKVMEKSKRAGGSKQLK
jgi:hypothetical protein